jgi:hypothetical protein
MAKKSKANSKKAVRKNAVPKKAAKKADKKVAKKSTGVKRSKEGFGNNPIRIILELVISDRSTVRLLSADDMLGGAPPPEISYEFDTENMDVSSLTIHGKKVDNPAKSGTVTLDSYPFQGLMRVNANGTGSLPQSKGTLQLKYQNKELFSPAERFSFTGSMGFINTTAKLS